MDGEFEQELQELQLECKELRSETHAVSVDGIWENPPVS